MDRWGNRDERHRRGRYDHQDYDRARDIAWRGTELDRGFSGRYEYDRGYDDGYERGLRHGSERDRDDRFRDREHRRDYWEEYPWSRGRGW